MADGRLQEESVWTLLVCVVVAVICLIHALLLRMFEVCTDNRGLLQDGVQHAPGESELLEASSGWAASTFDGFGAPNSAQPTREASRHVRFEGIDRPASSPATSGELNSIPATANCSGGQTGCTIPSTRATQERRCCGGSLAAQASADGSGPSCCISDYGSMEYASCEHPPGSPLEFSKYYVVIRGRHPGVYRSWAECQRQIHGFPGHSIASFKTELEARQYWELHREH